MNLSAKVMTLEFT